MDDLSQDGKNEKGGISTVVNNKIGQQKQNGKLRNMSKDKPKQNDVEEIKELSQMFQD